MNRMLEKGHTEDKGTAMKTLSIPSKAVAQPLCSRIKK